MGNGSYDQPCDSLVCLTMGGYRSMCDFDEELAKLIATFVGWYILIWLLHWVLPQVGKRSWKPRLAVDLCKVEVSGPGSQPSQKEDGAANQFGTTGDKLNKRFIMWMDYMILQQMDSPNSSSLDFNEERHEFIKATSTGDWSTNMGREANKKHGSH